MFVLTNKPDMGARLYSELVRTATCPQRGVDVMKVLQQMAGVLVETSLIFEKPDESLQASFERLGSRLECIPAPGALKPGSLPPAHVIDAVGEQGRQIARSFFEDWLDCVFEFNELILDIFRAIIAGWEEEGHPRAESLRLIIECGTRCMAFEIAAQELCDVVIEQKVVRQGWSLGDCIASLSAVAGRKLALSLNSETCHLFRGNDLPENLDQVVYVMTKEAVRLGVPAGTDWRMGLAANDVPLNAPLDLVAGIEPFCHGFFKAIALNGMYDQSVACAKAAGRMVAVASGGSIPELEPVIAKPLAMAAITETYKSVCLRMDAVGSLS
ncbi:MAG: hypothetical protein ACT4OY_06320 [Alphaproteobacteria bacterium]